MLRKNRVYTFGKLIVSPFKGLFMGNHRWSLSTDFCSFASLFDRVAPSKISQAANLPCKPFSLTKACSSLR